jgi:hypothetical protein
MKKPIKILAFYIFFLPVIFDIIGFIIDPRKIKYVTQYPFSYILDKLFSGSTYLIPYFVLLGLAYYNVFTKKPENKYFLQHKIAVICTTVFIVTGATLIDFSIFLNDNFSVRGRLLTKIVTYGFIPQFSVMFVLLIYGLGFFIGWILKRRQIVKS